MAENKQERKTFKWGDNEYLLDDLLKLHAQQEQSYYNFARDRGQYDDTALAGLRAAISSRIGAAKSGQTFSADGILDSDKVDNISIQTQKKGLFKKDKYVDQDNTEWAKYYLNKLVGQLKPYQKEEVKDSGAWDISKHGFEAYLSGEHGLNAKDIFQNYDKQDSNNPEAARSFAQRDERLRGYLSGYRDWLKSKNFDFTKNDNEWDDRFMTTLDSLINNTDWSDRTAVAASLRKLGSGEGYATAFTSDRWDLSKTDGDLQVEAQKRKEDEEAKKRKAHMDEYEDFAFSSRRESNPLYHKPYDYSSYDFDGKEANFMNWYGDLNQFQKTSYGTYLGRDNQKWNQAWVSYTNSLKGGPAYTDKNLGILLQGTFESQPNGFIDLGDGKYLIRDSVTDNGQGTVYDPTSGYTDTVFLGDLAGGNEEIKNVYKQLAYKYANDKYGTKYEDRPDIFKEGGELIPKNQYGNKVVYDWETTNDSIEPKAKAKGVSTKTQAARDQYINSDNKSEDNPNAGLTASQKARIGYAVLDLTSAVSAFAPGAGTAISAGTGLTSTFGNLWSDLTDDAVTTGQAWKNFGMNLGMDALGLIPGGGAASKMGKIVKSLKTVVPTLIAIPGVASMLANAPDIAESWKKAFDGDPEEGGSKMNYQDYMNILQVLNVATAGSNIARNAYKTAKKTTVKSDRIAVDVTDARGNRKALVLEGDDVDNFRAANDEGKAQEFIDKIEGGNKYKINETTESNAGKFWGRDQNDKFHLFNQNPFGRRGTGKANILEIRSEKLTDFWGNPQTTKKGTPKTRMYAETGRWESDLTGRDLIHTKGKENLDSWKATQQAAVEAPFTAWREKAAHYKARTDKAVELRGRVDADIQAKTASKSDVEAQIAARQQTIDESIAEANHIQNWLDAGGVATAKKTIKSARAKISKLKKSKAGKTPMQKRDINQRIAALEADIAKAKGELAANTPEAVLAAQDKASTSDTEKSSLQVEIDKLQSMLDNLTGRRDRLHTRATTHSAEYDAIKNFTPVKKTFNDVEYTFDVSPELKSLDGLFKQGGSINRNKINKFLNYAKG